MEVAPPSFSTHRWAFCSSLATLAPVFFWKDYFFIYDHRLLFITGLVLSRSLTNISIVSVIAWYFAFNGNDVLKSAISTNAHGFLSSIFVIFMAYAADSFIGRLKILWVSNIAYIMALVLFWKFYTYGVNWLLVATLVLLALGTSGNRILQDALQDLVNDIDKSPECNITRSIARATIWYRVAYVFGAILAISLWFAPTTIDELDSSWGSAFFICIIAMALAVIIFGFGNIVYRQDFIVCQAGFKKLLEYIFRCFKIFSREDKSPKNSNMEYEENEWIKLGKTLHLDTNMGEEKKNSSYEQEGNVILKSLLKMLPIWLVFSIESIISATGDTFFLQQYNNLDTDTIAVQFFSLVQDFSKFAIPFMYRRICCTPKNEKVKVGVGMLFGVVSCIFALLLEIYEGYISTSFLWLVPQFFMLGCMEGLIEEGILKFYKSQIKEEHLQSYLKEYIEFWMGIGKLLSIFLVLILQGWFGDKINDSRLDKYYVVLVCIGSINFIIYCFIARFFYKDKVLVDDEDCWV